MRLKRWELCVVTSAVAACVLAVWIFAWDARALRDDCRHAERLGRSITIGISFSGDGSRFDAQPAHSLRDPTQISGWADFEELIVPFEERSSQLLAVFRKNLAENASVHATDRDAAPTVARQNDGGTRYSLRSPFRFDVGNAHMEHEHFPLEVHCSAVAAGKRTCILWPGARPFRQDKQGILANLSWTERAQSLDAEEMEGRVAELYRKVHEIWRRPPCTPSSSYKGPGND